MTFSKLPPPFVARFNEDKALYESRIENKGDLPIEKSISRIAVLAIISAIFTTVELVQEGRILIASCVFFFSCFFQNSLTQL